MNDKDKFIEPLKDGPFIVKGGIDLENSKGETISEKAVFSLCRCGKSVNKPFCDGTHWHVKFLDEKN